MLDDFEPMAAHVLGQEAGLGNTELDAHYGLELIPAWAPTTSTLGWT
jgi:hypothetical protein